VARGVSRWPFTLALYLALLAFFVFAATGNASTYTTTCPDASSFTAEAAVASAQACAAIVERVEATQDTTAGSSGIAHGDVMLLVGAVLGAGFLPPLIHLLFGR
jgi:hypothetical protein